MIAASFVILWALRTTLSWVGEAVSGLVDGVGEGGCGNVGQENNDCQGTLSIGGMADYHVGGGENRVDGNFEADEDWDPEMVAEGLNYLGDTFARTRGYAPCWRSPFEPSFHGYRVYFQDGTWTDIH